MKLLFCFALLTLLSSHANSRTTVPEPVSFKTDDGGIIHADYYPAGTTAVVLAHGAIFNKESWRELAEHLVSGDISTLAIDFRGYGRSRGGNESSRRFEDILAAMRYLHERQDIEEIAVLGASMGGAAAGKAAVHAHPGDISRLLLLSPTPIPNPAKMRADNILYIASQDERGIATIKSQYQLAPAPKQLKLLKGNAHAQHIFTTSKKNDLIETIIHFLHAK